MNIFNDIEERRRTTRATEPNASSGLVQMSFAVLAVPALSDFGIGYTGAEDEILQNGCLAISRCRAIDISRIFWLQNEYKLRKLPITGFTFIVYSIV